ncbi:rhodanese-like domain-containing protein [Latilactobacillus curvatus]|uniref:rhodanese-like domain-containing protein n=1 Tax=Latilactobacillus curvatus TaxID=28038 RepID=UPI0011BAEBBA|nr:rhodanese-like domain-containing protein [Latilactobacillus curvatus]QEA48406.1 rhodanese-like domain-containing protein [Latilactobacillus curvatus]WBY49456.1 rhodanese-like domain-containing protein [Latilactobacillus curvatus]WIE01401.1 rhodanese-like domain-containing protein [Latilactobacillus curvatus]
MLVLGTINVWVVINIILIAILLWFLGDWAYYQIQRKRLGGELTEAAFEETMRKAQIVDLRDKKDFDAGHILGARNLPYPMLKQNMGELRMDLPVYLYDAGITLSIRAALKLRKAGFTDIKWLKKGYAGWTGKIKRKKKLN